MAPVPTARGDLIDSSNLGFTLVTECIIGPRNIEKEMNWPDHTFAEIPVEDRIADAVSKLNAAKRAGVDTICDRVIPGLGRDVRLVKRIAEQTPVNIVVMTGWYTWNDLPLYFVLRERFPHLLKEPEPTLEDLFVRDAEEGILDTGVRAGMIKIVTDHYGLSDGVRSAIRAAARAHRRTGVPLTTHTGIGIGVQTGLLQQQALIEEGVDLTRVNIGHVDWTAPDVPLGEFERLLQAGSFISFDTIGLDPQWPPDHQAAWREKRIERVVALINRGYVNQIMISHDNGCFYDVQPMHELPFPTYTEVIRDFLPKLKERGITEDHIRTMMFENPRCLFESKEKGSY
jgi:phosphotriesterase-related protein